MLLPSAPAKVKAPFVTIPIDNSDSQVPIFCSPHLCGSRFPDGIQQDSEATLGNSDGYGFCYRVRQEHLFDIEATCNCAKDEGGPLGAGLQEPASNRLKLHG